MSRLWYLKENLPTVSKLCETGTTPTLDMAPCEGRNPKTPQNEADTRTPPTVSIPISRYEK